MKTQVRDDAIAKNRKLVKTLTLACVAQSLSIIVLVFLVINALHSKTIVYQPVISGQYSLSERTFSPGYLRDMASDIAQLRLTWQPDTIQARYQRLLALVAPDRVASVRAGLNQEIQAVEKRRMSSVFYEHHVLVDVKHQAALVAGELQRLDDGVLLPLVHKTYQIQFHYVGGTLQVLSITEKEPQHG